MQIWPAIDLRGGKCVRLQQGDYARETVFVEDPVEAARMWVDQGAQFLHLVDLDGARDGSVANRESVQCILESVNVTTELGGGIRNESAIRELLESGLDRLVIGTKALKDPNWFRAMCQKFPDQLVLGIDARGGRVATDGWLETSNMPAIKLAHQFDGVSMAAVIYTDIETDGMLTGPNFNAMLEMKQAISTSVVASGGVTTVADIRRLAEDGLDGCIIGRTLYEGKLSLSEALTAAVKSEHRTGTSNDR